MGRYYKGDIEGKFWFAVQSSDDADFFGVAGEPKFLSYYFHEDDLDKIKEGIKTCFEELGSYHKRINDFIRKNEKKGFTYEKFAKDLNISEMKLRKFLVWYVRLGLGQKIRSCVELTGECSFEAEL